MTTIYQSLCINSRQSLALEIKLNKSIHSHEWKQLGDILYSWSLSLSSYKDTSYNVTSEQMNWIVANFDYDINTEPLQFRLIVN